MLLARKSPRSVVVARLHDWFSAVGPLPTGAGLASTSSGLRSISDTSHCSPTSSSPLPNLYSSWEASQVVNETPLSALAVQLAPGLGCLDLPALAEPLEIVRVQRQQQHRYLQSAALEVWDVSEAI